MSTELTKSVVDYLQTSDSDYINVGGYQAFLRLDTNVEEASEYPDIVLEDGSIIQDHMINKSTILSIKGQIGGIFKPNITASDEVNQYQSDKGIFSGFAPSLTTQATSQLDALQNNITNTANTIDSAYNDSMSLFKQFYSTSDAFNEEQRFCEYMTLCRANAILIQVSTGIQTYDNCGITTFAYTQNVDGTYDISLQVKVIEFVQTTTTEVRQVGNKSGQKARVQSLKNAMTKQANQAVKMGAQSPLLASTTQATILNGWLTHTPSAYTPV